MATRRYRYTWDHINALSADYMARWGAFVPGCSAAVGFDDEEEAFLIGFHMDGARDVFSAQYTACRIRSTACEADVHQEVKVERRPCRFGGHRVYFRCPSCWRGTLMLAVLPEGLRCGRCGSVTWGSRREHAPQRLIRRANKVAAKLECGEWSDPPTARPLHMRMVKFEALKTERQDLADRISERVDQQFLRSARVRRLLAQ